MIGGVFPTVPDHQECWQDTEGRLLVVEILERQQQVEDHNAAQYFFDDLAPSEKVFHNSIVNDLEFYFCLLLQ